MSKPHNTTGVLLTKTVAEYISVFEALEEMERTIQKLEEEFGNRIYCTLCDISLRETSRRHARPAMARQSGTTIL